MQRIPYIEANSVSEVVLKDRDRALEMIRNGRYSFGKIAGLASYLALPLTDRLFKRWFERVNPRYYKELLEIENILGISGVFSINLSYEWACTTAALGQSGDMYRILDWKIHHLGEYVVVVGQHGDAGPYYNVTWPAIGAIFQGMAPGRFSIAINQAPGRVSGKSRLADYLREKKGISSNHFLFPGYLLRQVFDTAHNFDQAVEQLSQIPITLPVIFTVCGVDDEQAAIIERTETSAVIRKSESGEPLIAANAFLGKPGSLNEVWRDRCGTSEHRGRLMAEYLGKGLSFSCLPNQDGPLINRGTALVMYSNARSGQLKLTGVNNCNVCTEMFDLDAVVCNRGNEISA